MKNENASGKAPLPKSRPKDKKPVRQDRAAGMAGRDGGTAAEATEATHRREAGPDGDRKGATAGAQETGGAVDEVARERGGERGGEQAGAFVDERFIGRGDELFKDMLELFPHGISVVSTLGRPVLILKDKATIEVLPVWMHPLDAGVALAELSQNSGASPHAVSKRVLTALGLSVESCVLNELVGHHQFAQLTLRNAGGGRLQLRVRADEAMSFCLQARAKFYSTREFMVRCRAVDVELSTLEQNLTEGQLPSLKIEMENSSKKLPYVM